MCKHIFANVIFCIILLNVQSMKIRGRTSSLTANEKTKSFPENAVIKIEPSEKSISLCKGDDCQKLDDFETKNKREEQKEKATTNMNFLEEKIQEERVVNGFETHKIKANVKCYGFDNTPSSREQLHEILRMRMRNHKDKFISKFLLNEFKTLIVTKSGRIDHSPNGHDDRVFSYMLAMYVWTEGKHLKERWGIEKHTIKTDRDEYDEICKNEKGNVTVYIFYLPVNNWVVVQFEDGNISAPSVIIG